MGDIKVIEISQSFQGEGPNTGRYITLVRFKACNLVADCHFCDTAVKMRTSHETTLTIKDINDLVNKRGLLISGGEPTIYLKEVLSILKDVDFEFCDIETNGFKLIELIKNINFNLIDNINFMFSPKIFKDDDLKIFQEKLIILKDYLNVYYKILCQPVGAYVEEQIESVLNKGISPSKIYLMPLGATPQEIERSMPIVLNMAEKFKCNLTSRLHIVHCFI